jgi:hypothetical protein
MTNLTITVDEDVLKRARIRAIEERTSVNSVLRAYLEAWSGADSGAQAAADLVALTQRVDAGSGPEGRTWTREDLYDR